MFARFLHCELAFLPSFCAVLFGKKSLCAVYTWVENYGPAPWGQSSYVNYLKFFHMGHFICLVFPNYLYIQSFISIRTHRYLLFTFSWEIKGYVHENNFVWMFIAALLGRVKRCKQTKCSFIGGVLNAYGLFTQ